jgi:hypothetical protein
VVTKNNHGAHKVVWTADHCGPRGSGNGGSPRKPYIRGRKFAEIQKGDIPKYRRRLGILGTPAVGALFGAVLEDEDNCRLNEIERFGA